VDINGGFMKKKVEVVLPEFSAEEQKILDALEIEFETDWDYDSAIVRAYVKYKGAIVKKDSEVVHI
jgi:hypothetical protein